MNDTRKDKRAPVSLKVRFKSATVDEFVEHYSRDISHGGLFIKSKQPMAIGTLLKFELQLKDESKLIQGVGRVVWKRDSTETTTEEAPAGMGIKFIKMDPESRAIVEKMVDQRGAEPGQYEAGGGDATKEDDDVSVGGAASTAARPVRSAKATMAFFPAANLTEADMPPPEDRTQVRQASEFLAAALAEGGEDNLASQEAEKKAEEARKRTEEIEKERDAAAAREKADAEAKERAEKEARERTEREKTERAAQEKADAEKKIADEKKKAEDAKSETKTDKAEAKPDEKKKDEPKKDEAKKAEPKKDESKKAEPKKDEAKKAEPKKDEKRPVVAAPVAAPPAEPQSNMLPIFLGVAVVVALGGYFVMSRNNETTPTHEVTPTPDPVPTVVEPTEPVVEPTVEPTVEEVVPPVAPTIQSVRIPATPSGAEVFLNGERLGLAPGPFDAPVGSTLDIRLAGHREAHVVVAEGVDSLEAALVPFPYVINVVTTPSGATVRVAGQTVTSPARVELAARPTAPTRIQATLTGFQNGTASVLVPSFAESDEAMVAEAQITLVAVPVRTPRVPATPTTMMEATTMTEATETSEPTMEAAPEPVMEATMEAAPEPEAVPENPF